MQSGQTALEGVRDPCGIYRACSDSAVKVWVAAEATDTASSPLPTRGRVWSAFVPQVVGQKPASKLAFEVRLPRSGSIMDL